MRDRSTLAPLSVAHLFVAATLLPPNGILPEKRRTRLPNVSGQVFLGDMHTPRAVNCQLGLSCPSRTGRQHVAEDTITDKRTMEL